MLIDCFSLKRDLLVVVAMSSSVTTVLEAPGVVVTRDTAVALFPMAPNPQRISLNFAADMDGAEKGSSHSPAIQPKSMKRSCTAKSQISHLASKIEPEKGTSSSTDVHPQMDATVKDEIEQEIELDEKGRDKYSRALVVVGLGQTNTARSSTGACNSKRKFVQRYQRRKSDQQRKNP